MLISDIRIKKRIRQSIGDISQLADSIIKLGLLQPIVIDSDNNLIAGYRRILAYQLLNWTDIPIIISKDIDTTLKALQAERDENTCRLDFAPSEAIEAAKLIEPLEREAAKERKATSNNERENFTPSDKGKALDKTAQAVGMSRPTYVKAKKIVEFASEQPTFNYIVKEMDATGKVDKAFKEMKRVKKVEFRQNNKVEISNDNNILIHGDFVAGMETLPDNSIALIFTDPPYDEKSIPLYGVMAEIASRKLKVGGSLLCYAGHYALPQLFDLMCPHLRYWWVIALEHSGNSARLPGKWVFVEWKPILWFVKNGRWNNEYVADKFKSSQPSKIEHEWQQDLSEAKYYIEQLTNENDFVVDPFAGSATTLLAALGSNRRCIGYEKDKERWINGSIRLQNYTREYTP